MPFETSAAPRSDTVSPARPTTETTSGTSSETTSGKTAQRRDPWFDNAKFLLVALVVVGHSWTLVPSNAGTAWIYDFLYAWHVPAFVLITGYLSRSFDFSRARMTSLLTTVVVPYVIFEALLATFRVQLGGERLERLWLNPHWPMWYLAALFFWRLATPVFKRMPLPVAVGTAVGISLVGGIVAPPDLLDISRAMGLLPFFVLGLKLRREHIAWLQRGWVQVAGAIALVVILLAARLTDVFISTEWLYYRTPYAELDVTPEQGMLIRGVLLVVGLTGALAVLSMVPTTRTWFTRLGAASLVVYLFHGFVIKGADLTDFSQWAGTHTTMAMLLVTLGAFAVAVLLAWPAVASRLNVVVDPVGALKKHAAKAPDPVRVEAAQARELVTAGAPTSGPWR